MAPAAVNQYGLAVRQPPGVQHAQGHRCHHRERAGRARVEPVRYRDEPLCVREDEVAERVLGGRGDLLPDQGRIRVRPDRLDRAHHVTGEGPG